MDLRKETKYGVYAISVLIASFMRLFLSKIISNYIPEGTYLSVLIDMLIIILVFIPVIRIIEKLTKKATTKYLDTAKKATKRNKRVGLYIALSTAFFIMFILFALVKYDLNVFTDLIK